MGKAEWTWRDLRFMMAVNGTGSSSSGHSMCKGGADGEVIGIGGVGGLGGNGASGSESSEMASFAVRKRSVETDEVSSLRVSF